MRADILIKINEDAKLKEYYQSVLSMRNVYLNKEISQNNMVLVKA